MKKIMSSISGNALKTHFKCRDTKKPYSRSEIYRYSVPEDKVSWDIPFADYKPSDYSSSSLNGKPWADDTDHHQCQFNSVDYGVNRVSFHGTYKLDGANGRPLNPIGRTGLSGRGVLGRWGPNHAADPIVSRFHNKRLQFVAIERGDTGELAIPGGMVDKGEEVSKTLMREFTEEALGGKKMKELKDFWTLGKKIYEGYVDDPRNTDNAWMESTVVNFHDLNGLFDGIQLVAGSDAATAKWVDVQPGLALYASHEDFIKLFAALHNVII